MTKKHKQVTFTTTQTVVPDKKGAPDPDNVKYCFEIIVGNVRFSTPWYMGKTPAIEALQKDMTDALKSALPHVDIKF
jgi:hypothetical protein